MENKQVPPENIIYYKKYATGILLIKLLSSGTRVTIIFHILTNEDIDQAYASMFWLFDSTPVVHESELRQFMNNATQDIIKDLLRNTKTKIPKIIDLKLSRFVLPLRQAWPSVAETTIKVKTFSYKHIKASQRKFQSQLQQPPRGRQSFTSFKKIVMKWLFVVVCITETVTMLPVFLRIYKIQNISLSCFYYDLRTMNRRNLTSFADVNQILREI